MMEQNSNSCRTRLILSSTALLVLLLVAPAIAAPIYSHDAFCRGVKCGTMDINVYETFKEPGRALDIGGVQIEGVWTTAKPSYYRYLQSVVQSNSPRDWVDGTEVPRPFVDTPPGGYLNDEWDYFPYYDQGEFPDFYDRPRRALAAADGGAISIFFETWVVCVLQEILGPNALQAQDDAYTVAPLVGWEWGYSITKTGKGVTRADYTVSMLPLAWRLAPSALFLASWGTVYGAGADMDFFNIGRGPCDECLDGPPNVPEPGTWVLLGSALAFLAIVRIRGQRSQYQEVAP